MNRERLLLVISILLFAGMAVYYLRPEWIGVPARKEALTVAVKPSPQGVAQNLPDQNLPEVKVQGEMVDASTPWGRNPFLTEAETKGKIKESDGLQVKTIIVGRPKSVATVNGRTVAVGERVGEETVWEIRADAVVLDRDGHKRVLKISEPAISIEVKEGKK